MHSTNTGLGFIFSFHARSSSGNQTVQATIMRHGKGKQRVARVATTIPMCLKSAWVYETSVSLKNGRLAHEVAPKPLHDGACNKKRIDHAWATLKSSIYIFARGQRTDDWRLGRLGRWTSTSLHCTINVTNAPYFSTDELRNLHAQAINTLQLHPRNEITFANAMVTEDKHLPSQRGGSFAVVVNPSSRARTQQGIHSNCNVKFWLAKKNKLDDLKQKCSKYHISIPANTWLNRNLLEEHLALHFHWVRA